MSQVQSTDVRAQEKKLKKSGRIVKFGGSTERTHMKYFLFLIEKNFVLHRLLLIPYMHHKNSEDFLNLFQRENGNIGEYWKETLMLWTFTIFSRCFCLSVNICGNYPFAICVQWWHISKVFSAFNAKIFSLIYKHAARPTYYDSMMVLLPNSLLQIFVFYLQYLFS